MKNNINGMKFLPVALGFAAMALSVSGQALPNGPAKATIEKVCSTCHGADIVIGMKNSKDAWQGIVATMKGRGAVGSDADFTAIVDYLAANFGTAPAPATAGGAPRTVTAQKGRPKLFVREEWKQSPGGGEHPLKAENVANPNLELKLYSNASFDAGKSAPDGGILMTGADKDDSNPSHLWTGICAQGCMAAFRHKTSYVDLTGLARITMNVKTSGLHVARVAVKLADGTWLIGDKGVGTPTDWLVSDIAFSELRWQRLNTDRMVPTGNFIANPDLSKVDEFGIVELLPGSGHGQGGWIDVAQIEVYGGSVPR
jgi:hypothetical protein